MGSEADKRGARETMDPEAIKQWDGLLLRLLQDRLPRISVDAIAEAFAEPPRALIDALRALRENGTLASTADAEVAAASTAWARVRERAPAVACFPLGPVTERATKRCVLGIVAAARRHTSDDARLAALQPARALLSYATLWLFELAVMDLRGSSRTLREDFGFLYHFLPNGRPRGLREELVLRRGLMDAAARLAKPIVTAWLNQPAAGTRGMISALQRELSVPFVRPSRTAGRVAVLGLSRQAARALPEDVEASAARHIFFHGDGANGRLDLTELIAACGGGIDSRVADLIDIAATVYLADIHLPRDAQFAREFSFVIEVRQPEVWTRHADALAQQLSFLSLNPANFRFLQRGSKDRTPVRRLPRQTTEGCASLFSGGLDSFAGAAQLVSEGRRAFLVSHDPGPMVHGIQRRLADALGARSASGAANRGKGPIAVTVPVRAEPKAPALNRLGTPPPQVLYQHTRSFLFLSLATAVALQNGLGEVLVFENGPIALNPAFSESRTNTRTTHPLFLAAFARMVASVFGVELTMRNPFELLTKGEVARGIDERWHPEIRRTNSCWSYSKVKLWAKDARATRFEGSHCGRCLPCIWRRAAIRKAGLTAQDDGYLWDALPARQRDRWLSRTHLTVLLDQLRFCRNALTLPDAALIALCPDLIDGQGSLADRLAMVRRAAAEIDEWFRDDAGKLMQPAIRYHLTAPPDRRVTATADVE